MPGPDKVYFFATCLIDLLYRMLDKKPENRPQDGKEAAAALRLAVEEAPVTGVKQRKATAPAAASAAAAKPAAAEPASGAPKGLIIGIAAVALIALIAVAANQGKDDTAAAPPAAWPALAARNIATPRNSLFIIPSPAPAPACSD